MLGCDTSRADPCNHPQEAEGNHSCTPLTLRHILASTHPTQMHPTIQLMNPVTCLHSHTQEKTHSHTLILMYVYLPVYTYQLPHIFTHPRLNPPSCSHSHKSGSSDTMAHSHALPLSTLNYTSNSHKVSFLLRKASKTKAKG